MLRRLQKMMALAMVIALFTALAGAALGSLGGVLTSQRLTAYRLRELERRVERLGQLLERTFRLEGRMDQAEHSLRELRGGGAA